MTDITQAQGKKYSGIYYTDILTGDNGADTLTCSKIVGTSDVDLIDERINEARAKHLNQPLILVRDKV